MPESQARAGRIGAATRWHPETALALRQADRVRRAADILTEIVTAEPAITPDVRRALADIILSVQAAGAA